MSWRNGEEKRGGNDKTRKRYTTCDVGVSCVESLQGMRVRHVSSCTTEATINYRALEHGNSTHRPPSVHSRRIFFFNGFLDNAMVCACFQQDFDQRLVCSKYPLFNDLNQPGEVGFSRVVCYFNHLMLCE